MDAAQKPSVHLIRLGATLSIAGGAGLAFVWPRLAGALIYERADILAGQAWRLWTGHLVHYTGSHLVWDLAVFLAAGLWLEWIRPRLTRWFYLLTPPAISAALWWGDPTLERYAGLSGLATGVLVLLALVQRRRDAGAPPWFWPAVLLLVAVKVVAEATTQVPLFARMDAGVRVVPLAHLGGIVCALLAFLAAQWQERHHARLPRTRPNGTR
jgi:rhomboid family GlyGly-CTERM serine protease